MVVERRICTCRTVAYLYKYKYKYQVEATCTVSQYHTAPAVALVVCTFGPRWSSRPTLVRQRTTARLDDHRSSVMSAFATPPQGLNYRNVFCCFVGFLGCSETSNRQATLSALCVSIFGCRIIAHSNPEVGTATRKHVQTRVKTANTTDNRQQTTVA
jgi:hypothetical protein